MKLRLCDDVESVETLVRDGMSRKGFTQKQFRKLYGWDVGSLYYKPNVKSVFPRHVKLIAAALGLDLVEFANSAVKTEGVRNYPANSFGYLLKLSRYIIGVTSVDVATLLGTDHKSVTRWEHGEIRPSLKRMSLISKMTKIPTDELFGLLNRNDVDISPYTEKFCDGLCVSLGLDKVVFRE